MTLAIVTDTSLGFPQCLQDIAWIAHRWDTTAYEYIQISSKALFMYHPTLCNTDTEGVVKYLFLVSWGGVRLSPLGTSATNWPIVPAPDDRRWVWSNWWNENLQGKPKYSEKTCCSVTFSTTDPIWPDLGSNPSRRGGKPLTNRLSYDTAFVK
jgi:hypothetical protein